MNINIRSLVSAVILSAFAMSFSSCTFTVTVNNGDAIAIGLYRDDPSTTNQRRMYLDNIQLKVVSYK